MFKLLTCFRLEKDFLFLEKYNDKPITLFNDYVPLSKEELRYNPYNFIIVHEPNEFFGFHDWVIKNHDLFSVILTWNKDILETCPNSALFTCNYQQDSIEYYNIFKNKNKTFEVSFLSGIKTITEGHILRNKLYILKDKINIPKKWFHVLEDFDTTNNVRPGYGDYSKDLSHLPEYLKHAPQVYGKRICYEEPMFHVCVENVKSKNWYTEKIGEAFCTKTLPIYWGCPNIGEYYDIRGIITFETEDELLDILNNLTPEEYYKRKPYIDYNYQVALLDSFENKLDSLFKDIIDLNNL